MPEAHVLRLLYKRTPRTIVRSTVSLSARQALDESRVSRNVLEGSGHGQMHWQTSSCVWKDGQATGQGQCPCPGAQHIRKPPEDTKGGSIARPGPRRLQKPLNKPQWCSIVREESRWCWSAPKALRLVWMAHDNAGTCRTCLDNSRTSRDNWTPTRIC